MTHLEFVVPGPPVSNQVPGANLNAWRGTIASEARAQWRGKAVLATHLKAVVINFYVGKKPSVDVDNMSKPILDSMEGIVYDDDRQIIQAELSHVEIGSAFVFVGVSKLIVSAVQAGTQFVYVRVEDPNVPLPLPK
jgi:crossover junction endodeoxyribonuclease RusA